MAQGIAWNKEKVIEALKPYFQLGCSVRKACKYAGIAESTFNTWIGEDLELRVQIEAWQNENSAMARKNWREKVRSGDYQASKEWLERYPEERKDFSPRSEIDITSKDEAVNVDSETKAELKLLREQMAREYEEKRKKML